MASEVISDLLAIPDLRERAAILGDNPQVRNLVEQALAADQDYAGADEAGRGEIRAQLGFPAPTPGATQLGFSPNFPMTDPRVVPIPTAMTGKGTLYPEETPTLTKGDYFASKGNAIIEGADAELKRLKGLMDSGALRPSDVMIPATAAWFKKNITAEMVKSAGRDDLSSRVARGVLSSVPFLAAGFPQEMEHPKFFSIENVARTATDIIITAPVFALAAATGVPGLAVGAGAYGAARFAPQLFRIFTANPGLARVVHEAFLTGGVDAAYRGFVNTSTEMIQKGTLVPNPATFASNLAPDFLNGFMFMLGFAGVVHGVRANVGFKNTMYRSVDEGIFQGARKMWGNMAPGQIGQSIGVNQIVNPPDLQAQNPFAPPVPRDTIAQTFGRPLADNTPLTLPGASAASEQLPAAYRDAVVNVPQQPGVVVPGPVRREGGFPPEMGPGYAPPFEGPPGPGALLTDPASQTTELLKAAQATQVVPVSQAQELLGGRPTGPPVPGWMRSAEEKLRDVPTVKPFTTDPKQEAAFTDIAVPNKLSLHPNGDMSMTIAEPVLKSQFVHPKDAVAGDFVYWNKKDGTPRVGSVVEKLEDGMTVNDGERQVFLKYETAGTAKRPFAVDSEVYSSSGEPLIVKGYTPEGKVWVIDNAGNMRMELNSSLRSYDMNLTAKETTERLSQGITTPAPTGTSVFEIFTDEAGALRFDGWKRRNRQRNNLIGSGQVIPMPVATQVTGKDYGLFQFFLDPLHILGLWNNPKYDLASKMLMDAKTYHAIEEGNTIGTLREWRKLLGGGSEMHGADIDKSRRLMRFAVGTPFPGETLDLTERHVLDQFNDWARRELIPMINAKRALFGRPPVPADYNWPLQLFPEIVLNNGYSGGGVAKAWARGPKGIKVLGRDNEIEVGGTAARLHVNGNFWDLAQQAMNWANHEKIWRDPIVYLKNLAKADASSSRQKYLNWFAGHLDGKNANPTMSDITEFSYRVDQRLMKMGYKTEGSIIEIPSQTNHQFESPYFSFAEKDLGKMALGAKQMSYANGIAWNMRTMLMNLTQPWTHVLPQMPGGVQGLGWNAAEIIAEQSKAHVKAVNSLFNKDALALYAKKGVIHDVEEVFQPSNVTHLSGDLPANIQYVKDWFSNNFFGLSFLNMRVSEIINRVTGYEAMSRALKREAEKAGYGTYLNDPAFVEAIDRAAVYATNINNFLYGKGFKSPLQTDFGIGLGSGGKYKQIRSMAAPLGELMYQYNTFGFKTIGLMMNAAKQADRLGGHQPLHMRLAEIDSPQEFSDFMLAMKPADRYTFLRYMMYSTAVASFVSGAMGLNGMFWQIMPTSALPNNVLTPSLMTLAKAFGHAATLNFGRSAGTLWRGFAPAPLPGSTAWQRFERGGRNLDVNSLFATRSEIEGKPSPFAPDDISTQFGFGGGQVRGR